MDHYRNQIETKQLEVFLDIDLFYYCAIGMFLILAFLNLSRIQTEFIGGLMTLFVPFIASEKEALTRDAIT